MPERAAEVQVVVGVRADGRRAPEIHDQSEHADDEYARGVDGVRIAEPSQGLDDDCNRSDQEQDAVHLRRDHL